MMVVDSIVEEAEHYVTDFDIDALFWNSWHVINLRAAINRDASSLQGALAATEYLSSISPAIQRPLNISAAYRDLPSNPVTADGLIDWSELKTTMGDELRLISTVQSLALFCSNQLLRDKPSSLFHLQLDKLFSGLPFSPSLLGSYDDIVNGEPGSM